MASVSAASCWLELKKVLRPKGSLRTQTCFPTYLSVNHAATIWVEQSIFPPQVAIFSIWGRPLWALEVVVRLCEKPQSKSIEGLWNIHLIQLAAPFWRLARPPAGHRRHVLLCPSLWMFVLICRCTQLTWINNYSHRTQKKKKKDTSWANRITLKVHCLPLINDTLMIDYHFRACGRFKQRQHKVKPGKRGDGWTRMESCLCANFPANSSVYLKSITA